MANSLAKQLLLGNEDEEYEWMVKFFIPLDSDIKSA